MGRTLSWFTPKAALLLAALAITVGSSVAVAADEASAQREATDELIRLTVRTGHEAEIEHFLERLATAARRTGAPVRWRTHRQLDGERPLYVLVLRASSKEQLDAWRSLTVGATLERAYGVGEARRLLALREAALESMHHERFVPQPELSFDD